MGETLLLKDLVKLLSGNIYYMRWERTFFFFFDLQRRFGRLMRFNIKVAFVTLFFVVVEVSDSILSKSSKYRKELVHLNIVTYYM